MKKTMTVFCIFFIGALSSGQDIPHQTGTWNGDELGNHRVIVRVSAASDAVRVHVPWRRRDANPEKKSVIFVDGKTGNRVANVFSVEINREFGDVLFQPSSGPGDYYLYYMAYRLAGSRNYPNAVYLAPAPPAAPEWLTRHGLADRRATSADLKRFPAAEVVAFQSVDEFNSRVPMELIATAEETRNLLAKYLAADYLVFPEDRSHSIRMTDDLPLRWIEAGPGHEFSGEAARGESYSFQVGIYACRADIPGLDVVFGELKNEAGGIIPSSAFRCINTGGVDWNGKPLLKTVAIPKGKIQALWCGVQVPADIESGNYRGALRIRPGGLPESEIQIALKVTNDILLDAGDSDPCRMSRLRWLDSTLAFDDDVVAPFTPLDVEGETVTCLGRAVRLAKSGFPARISSFFAPEVTRLVKQGRDLLTSPIELIVEDIAGTKLEWEEPGFKFTKRKPGAVGWEASPKSGPLSAEVRGFMEMDGYLEFEVKLSTSLPLEVKDISLKCLSPPMSRNT